MSPEGVRLVYDNIVKLNIEQWREAQLVSTQSGPVGGRSPGGQAGSDEAGTHGPK